MFSYKKGPYFIPCFLYSLSIFYFCGITPYPTLKYNLLYCLFLLHSPFVWSVAWWRPAVAGSSTPCMPGATPSQLVVPVPLTPLFLIQWFDISLYLRLGFMVSTNQCFYQDTISRKTATQGWRVLSTHETDCPPSDTNPVF